MAGTKQHSLISTFEMVSSSDFREDFASLNDWQNYMEYNRDTLIDGSPAFLEQFLLLGLMYLRDLLLNCNNTDSFEIAARNIEKSANFVIGTAFHLEENTTKYILILYYTIFLRWQWRRCILCEQ